MKMVKSCFLLLGLALAVSSCGPALSPFTQRLYDENRWTDNDLKRIQFYVSDDIVLQRQISDNRSEIISGEIKIVDGRQVEEIVIRRGTPGVFLFSPKADRFAVSFEDGSNDRFLMFGPNPKAGDRYVLLASDWDRDRGSVRYEGKLFRVDASNAFAHLLVDMKKIRKVSVASRTAGGRKIE